MTGFNIHLEGDYYLTVDQVWPDGDAPENPTAADVAAVMASCGPQWQVLCDWNIDDVVVDVDGVEVQW